MSVTRNFRVTVNLSNFFHDHRNRARIFINDDIQTISDLEERIEKIFNIKNFHLTSQNEFLPPTEDARILQKDDIIWVIQNGDSYVDIFTPKVATKKVTKESDSIGKKRSISLTDQYIEEELQSPKKKKKKKHELEINQESLSSNYECKRKKKKEKRADTVSSEEKCTSTETKYNSPKPKKNKKNNVDDLLSENKVSATPEKDLNSPKNNVMKIDTLFPVLQSHINTYNKKMSSNQLNKTASPLAASETTSPSVIKGIESENEKKERYTYKGNLSRYKRNKPLPTITDKYLEQKKINIVKIEYLGGRPGAVGACDSKTGSFNQNSENQNIIAIEDQNDEDITKQNTISLHNINLATGVISSPRINNEVKEMQNFDNGTSMETCNKTETNNMSYTNANEDLIDNNLNQHLNTEDTSTRDVAISEHETKTNTVLITKVPSPTPEVTFALSKNISGCTSSLSSYKEEIFKNIKSVSSPKSSQIDLSNLKDKSEGRTPPEVKKWKERFSNTTHNMPRVVLRHPNIPYQQKYFTFKGLASKQCKSSNTSDSSKVTINIDKENSTSNITSTKDDLIDLQNIPYVNEYVPEKDTSDNKINKSSPDDVLNQSYEPSKRTETILNSNITVEKLSNISNSTNLSIATDDKSSKTTTELLDNTINKSGITASGTNDPGNYMKDSNTSLLEDYKNFVASEMDSAKDITNLDNTDVSKISAGGMSRFLKLRQQSGIGQLLEDLRSNESVVSVESVDSDCSQFVTKRKRKRVRKKKKKDTNIDSDTSFNDSSVMITDACVPKSLNVKACPSIHIRFDDDDEGGELKVTDLLKEKGAGIENDSYIQSITLESDLEESKLEKAGFKEEDILKSPSMKQMLPKIGDFIAFKILKITENYTPEVSSYITGKVIQFNTETKQVTYEILNGLEQCETPKGKLSMEVDAGISETISNQREFAWVDLIDPRLLFP